MKLPESPPPWEELITGLDPATLGRILKAGADGTPRGEYLHWDELRRRPAPESLTHREWWFAVKLARNQMLREISLLVDKNHRPFQYSMPDPVLEMVHRIDRHASGRIGAHEQVTNPETRDRYLISSLIEEAITSSQLEGASTTSAVAREMIRSGRKPRDKSERMILNNFLAMSHIRELKDEELTPELVLELHQIVAEGTLDDPSAVGRVRRSDEEIRVVDATRGLVLHTPPPANELAARMTAMCRFANGAETGRFVHPVSRAVVLHFWLAYDHPFVDGNGRAARALFYWSMLHEGYWLCEYLSISNILKGAPAKYARSFLHTETDDNDLTYFIIHQLRVILRAIDALHEYLDRKTEQIRETSGLLRKSESFNHRQAALLSHALRHPGFRYTIKSHQNSHAVVYQTARSDLLDLAESGLLEVQKSGNAYVFSAPPDLNERLKSR